MQPFKWSRSIDWLIGLPDACFGSPFILFLSLFLLFLLVRYDKMFLFFFIVPGTKNVAQKTYKGHF